MTDRSTSLEVGASLKGRIRMRSRRSSYAESPDYAESVDYHHCCRQADYRR